MNWRHVICGGLLLASAAGWAVSRVGPGTLSNDEMMFETVTPSSFSVDLIGMNGDLRFEGPSLILPGANGPQPQLLNIFMLANERQDLKDVNDRTQMENLFLQAGWTKHPHPQECIDWFEKNNGQTLTATLVWGHGRGVILTGGLTRDNLEAIELMSLHVRTGGCGWN